MGNKTLNIKDLNRNEIREMIVDRVGKIHRKGIDNVLKYIQDDHNGYFVVSCHRHHHFRGGMARHALGVYLGIQRSDSHYLNHANDDSLAIIGLFHDISNTYGCHFRGHGRGSVALLKHLGLELLPEEEHAILHHMFRHHESEWAKAYTLGRVSAPNSKERLLLYMLNDSRDASLYPYKRR